MKRKPAAAPTRRRKQAAPAPVGLRLLFQSLQHQGFTDRYGWISPEPFMKVFAALQRTEQMNDTFRAALKAACRADSPGAGFGPKGNLYADECADSAINGGFWAGVAVAWQAMMAMQGNGKGGGR